MNREQIVEVLRNVTKQRGYNNLPEYLEEGIALAVEQLLAALAEECADACAEKAEQYHGNAAVAASACEVRIRSLRPDLSATLQKLERKARLEEAQRLAASVCRALQDWPKIRVLIRDTYFNPRIKELRKSD